MWGEMQEEQGAPLNNKHLIFVRERKGSLGFSGGSRGKEPPTVAGDGREVGSISGSGRSLGGRHGSPLQYSCLENPLVRGAWRATVHWAAKSRTRLSRLRMHGPHRIGIHTLGFASSL